MDPKRPLRLGILQETVDILMVPISWVYAGLDRFFCFSGSQPLAEDPLSKGGPRMENGDDLDDLNVAHA